MSGLKIGSLFSGFGGLDSAVEEVFDARTAWVSDIDKGACKILKHRYPDVPNLGDIAAIKWTPDCPDCGALTGLYDRNGDGTGEKFYHCTTHGDLPLSIRLAEPGVPEPIDILTGGSPCQDLSHAGKRAGMTEGTRSNLWVAMREAIAQLKPTYVIWENVRGAYSAAADSDLEPCAGCVGDATGTHLRALGRVLGDLSELGFDARWHGLRAADVGACHGRFRVFVVAHAQGHRWDQGRAESARLVGRPDVAVRGDEAVTLFPTPTVDDAGNITRDSGSFQSLTRSVQLLPTPAVNDMGAGKTVEHWDEWTDAMKSKHGNGNGHGPSLSIEALRLLPTPTTQDAANDGGPSQFDRNTPPLNAMVKLLPTPSVADSLGGHERRGGARGEELLLNGMAKAGHLERFGQYAAAIARWEHVLGRPAPAPTEPTGRNGAHRLSARFVEWMQGCPEGWITGVPGITRNEALKALGNGVVRQQCVAALRLMLAQERVA